MTTLFTKIKQRAVTCMRDDRASSELPVTILLIVSFAIAAIGVGNWITTAALNKGADVAACIEGSNALNAGGSSENCEKKLTTESKSNQFGFEKDSMYKKRFGGE